MADQWFRLYNSFRHDRKIKKLSDSEFRAWVTLLSVASEENGILPKSIEDIAMELGVSASKARKLLAALLASGLLEHTDNDDISPHNWDDRQFKSDTSRERQQRYRDRHKSRHSDGDSDVTCDVTVTAQEKIQNRTEKNLPSEDIAAKPLAVPKPKFVLPDWVPKDAWEAFAKMRGKRFTAGARDLNLRTLEKLREAGEDPRAVLEQTVERGWTGLFPVKPENSNGSRPDNSRKPTPHDRAIRALADIAGIDTGGSGECGNGAGIVDQEPRQLALVVDRSALEDPAPSDTGGDQCAPGEVDPALLAAGHDRRPDAFPIPRFLLRS